MCPICVTTAWFIVAGPVSTGGLAALAVKISQKKNSTTEIIANEKSIPDVNQHVGEPESSLAGSRSAVEINPRQPSSL